jgi:predicted ATP-grasp superfamily ATP-dependent carboligase
MINTAPAVVVRAGLNGLGVIRSLARGAVPTIVMDTTRWRPAMWSRFCRTTVVDSLDGRSLVDNLLALQKKITGQPVLILTDDAAVKTVSEHREELRSAYRFHLPPQGVVSALESKTRFYQFAEQHGLPVPRMMIVRQDTPLDTLSSLPFPVIVKSSQRQRENPSPTESFRVYTLKDAEKLCKRLLESTEELIVEEWIDGPDSNVCFALFHRSREPDGLKIFAGRNIAGGPTNGGTPALCLAAPEVMAGLEPLVMKFLDVAEYQGLGSLEFKWDGRQGRYAIVGLTVGRTDCYEEIATLSGFNLPLAAYRHELGMQPLHQVEIDRTVAWRESSLRGKGLSMLSPNMRVYDGYWRADDPLPGVFFYGHTALAWAYRHAGKPVLDRIEIGKMHPALEKTYQNFVKPIFHRGKAGTS